MCHLPQAPNCSPSDFSTIAPTRVIYPPTPGAICDHPIACWTVLSSKFVFKLSHYFLFLLFLSFLVLAINIFYLDYVISPLALPTASNIFPSHPSSTQPSNKIHLTRLLHLQCFALILRMKSKSLRFLHTTLLCLTPMSHPILSFHESPC